MSRPCARRQDHETAIAATGSRLVLNRREGTAGASHSAADRCAAASQAASPAIPGNRRSPRVTASSTARQSPDGDPDGAAGRAASSPETSGFPSNRGDFLIADSCNFAAFSDYRTPVHFAALAFAGTGGPVVTGRAAPWGGAGWGLPVFPA